MQGRWYSDGPACKQDEVRGTGSSTNSGVQCMLGKASLGGGISRTQGWQQCLGTLCPRASNRKECSELRGKRVSFRTPKPGPAPPPLPNIAVELTARYISRTATHDSRFSHNQAEVLICFSERQSYDGLRPQAQYVSITRACEFRPHPRGSGERRVRGSGSSHREAAAKP